MSMTTKLPNIPLSSFLYVTVEGHLIFTIPAVIGILLLNLMDVRELFFELVPIALISIPISAAFAWFIAKGSNWVNTNAALRASCRLPGKIYGVLFGGLLGFHFCRDCCLFRLTRAVLSAVHFVGRPLRSPILVTTGVCFCVLHFVSTRAFRRAPVVAWSASTVAIPSPCSVAQHCPDSPDSFLLGRWRSVIAESRDVLVLRDVRNRRRRCWLRLCVH